MNIFFDSSFFFPFIKIDVEKLSSIKLLKAFQSKKFSIIRSDLVIFEIAAKGTKYVNDNIISDEDLAKGINSIINLENVKVIPFYFSEILNLATIFRKDHSDFIDCLTLASAIIYADILITLDDKLIDNIEKIWKDKIYEINNEFKALTWVDFEKDFLR